MIPKIINIIVGPTKFRLINQCINSWRILEEEGFKVEIWDDEKILIFLKKNLPKAIPLIENARNHAEVSDIARYAIIYFKGGYYMDWDIELLSVQGFLEFCEASPNGFLITDFNNGSIASECFSGQANDPYLLSLLEDIISVFEKGEHLQLSTPDYTGPFRMQMAYHANRQFEGTHHIIDVKSIFRYDYIQIRKLEECNYSAPLMHYWVHSWMDPI